jgi:hypothetical protein
MHILRRKEKLKFLMEATLNRRGPGQGKVHARWLASLTSRLQESICNDQWGFCVSQRE